MKIELDELELETVKAALQFFKAHQENWTGEVADFSQFVCPTLGALTEEENDALVERLDRTLRCAA